MIKTHSEIAGTGSGLASATAPWFDWVGQYLLPCPFKYFTGYDCLGCGLQRSLLLLLKGEMGASFSLYPATIPLLVLVLFYLLRHWFRFDPKEKTGRVLAIFTGVVAIGSYILKIWHGHLGQ